MTTKAKFDPELQQRVTEIAKGMDFDPWKKNLILATDFVLRGEVDLGAGVVKSAGHQYQIDTDLGCTCLSSTHQSKYCKHYVAYEIQRRLEGGDMPKATPQDQWEAKVQTGEAVDDLFGEDKPAELDGAVVGSDAEEDDIPEPHVPEKVSRAAQAAKKIIDTPLTRLDEETLDVIEDALDSVIVQRHEGHQYTDYPATFCIKRVVGRTEVMCTFRGTNDDEVWERTVNKIHKLEETAKRYEQPPQAPAPGAQAQPPPQATYATTAVGQVPFCPVHQRPMKPSQFEQGKWYCTGKNEDGSYCKTKV